MNHSFDVKRDCQLLKKDKTFKNLFNITCAHDDAIAAEWLEDGKIKNLTFNELRSQTDSFSKYFISKFGTTGRVCICVDSCKEWFPLFWGLIRSGHDVLSVDAASTDDKLASKMKTAGCDKLVSAKKRDIACTQILLSELECLELVTGYEPVWGKNIALCTSGTTADSRIFVYDETSICETALLSDKVFESNKLLINNKSFKTLAFLPFHHILGFAAVFIWSQFLGDTLVYLKDRAPQTIVETSTKCRINQIVTVPILANNLCRGVKTRIEQKSRIAAVSVEILEIISLGVQAVFPRTGLALAKLMFGGIRKKMLGNDIRSLVLGGSSTDRRTLRHLNALGYFTISGFGMTETCINSMNTGMGLYARLRGSIGTPLSETEFKIKDTGQRRQNRGELLIRGKCLHDGRILDGKILPPDRDTEGWFSTGDVVKYTKFNGKYFILGRIKDVIINESGENVYPDELEEHFRNILVKEQYTVLGTRKKSSRYEDICLVVSAGPNADDDSYLKRIETQVIKINRTLPVYKRLTRAMVCKEPLPLSSSMKIKRNDLRDRINHGGLEYVELDLSKKTAKTKSGEKEQLKARQQLSEKLRRQLTDMFAEVLNKPASQLDPDANLVEDLGGDSLQMLSIISKAEEGFGVMIPAESYTQCMSINDAGALIEKLISGENCGSEAVKLEIRQPVSKFEDTEEFAAFQKRLEGMLANGAKNPYFVCHDSPLLDTSVVEGREMLDFGSYNYAGMSGRKEVSDAAKAAIDRWGTSASGSRLLAGEKPVHGELERAIAEWKHAEAALVCVGGHSTNVTIVGNFCGKKDLILYDALAHNSVEQGCRLSQAVARPFPHSNVEALEKVLQAQRKYFEKVLIVIEGVYSMDGDISPVPEFVALKKKYGCFLMVDEAHSACVLGPTGGGVDEYFGLAPDDIDIKMGTLSKGLGTCGGYLAGKKSLIDYLRYSLPGFVFSVGISPALAAGSLEAVRLLRSKPEIMENLHRNIRCFAEEAKKRKLDICLGGNAAVIPVMVGRDEDAFALSTELENRGILVPPAVYPAVQKNKARLRFDVISEHRPEQIVMALDTLVQAAADLGINLPQKDC